ncbi:PAS domain-containing sensor histidine kinase [Haloarchaeobius iranensis]|uniref:histidine kinase n=1 Tax=Haloarchaeobius iranensis TaxID=996166 RepID=A0A1G9X2S6_9EURY|nr:PAS domain-containing sensor histidine kinase [Haloarchaeobius iranensis]SDM91040.1 PAS domain S-box-containing protein [Haloarchaeobius iranensis]
MVSPPDPSALLDYTQAKLTLVDEEGTITYVNAAAGRILGYEPETLVGTDAFEHVHPEDRERVVAAFEEVVADEPDATSFIEYRYGTVDDDWVWLQSRLTELEEADVDGYVVSSHDVTERIEAERERQNTETRLQEIAAKTGDVLWMFSGDWSECLFVNPAYESVYGLPVETLHDDPWSFLDAVHPDDVRAVEAEMRRLSGGEAVDLEYRVNPDREYRRWAWVQAEPVVVDGEVERIVGFSRDVTERRRREQQLAVMDKLLRHNIRNDMNVVIGEAEHIDAEDGSTLSERTRVIRDTAAQLIMTAEKQREIIELLTDPGTLGEVDITAAVTRVGGRMRERYPDAEVEIDVPERATAFALPGIETAIAELAENAIVHATGGPPTLRLVCRTTEESVAVEVLDDCEPIPEYEYRVITGEHEMDDLYHSSGVGLWLVYWLVELSDGDIEFETLESSGNRVQLTFTRVTD